MTDQIAALQARRETVAQHVFVLGRERRVCLLHRCDAEMSRRLGEVDDELDPLGVELKRIDAAIRRMELENAA